MLRERGRQPAGCAKEASCLQLLGLQHGLCLSFGWASWACSGQVSAAAWMQGCPCPCRCRSRCRCCCCCISCMQMGPACLRWEEEGARVPPGLHRRPAWAEGRGCRAGVGMGRAQGRPPRLPHPAERRGWGCLGPTPLPPAVCRRLRAATTTTGWQHASRRLAPQLRCHAPLQLETRASGWRHAWAVNCLRSAAAAAHAAPARQPPGRRPHCAALAASPLPPGHPAAAGPPATQGNAHPAASVG